MADDPRGEDHDERRRERREALLLKVEYDGASDLVTDYTENISRGGTFVLTRRALAEGTPIRLSLSFPGLLQPLTLAGVVRWLRLEPEEERGVGVEFDELDDDTRSRLDELIARIAGADPTLVARSIRVLLVEDNPHVATLIREGLTAGQRRELAGRVSFEFTTVENGRDALARLRAGGIDVLIVDVYLPILDGAHVIEQVRADPVLRRLPIVALSAGGPGARAAATAAGADFYLDKPVRLADIVATMRRLMGLMR
jgi:uncharacterized protein (TIGR02266 family)